MEQETTDINEFEAVVQSLEEASKQAPETQTEMFELPDKLKGKTFQDVVKMYQEAEKVIGRQAQEVGEVRKLADQLITSQLASTKTQPTPETPEPDEIDDVDFFADPKNTVLKLIEKHPVFQQAQKTTQTLAQKEAKQALEAKHSDYKQLLEDDSFKSWVSQSPVRQKLLTSAHLNFDVDAADELFSTFKELKKVKQMGSANELKQGSDEALSSVSVGVAGGSGEVSKKIFRRADLINLKIRNPDKYEALEGEILKAYAEGRVR